MIAASASTSSIDRQSRASASPGQNPAPSSFRRTVTVHYGDGISRIANANEKALSVLAEQRTRIVFFSFLASGQSGRDLSLALGGVPLSAALRTSGTRGEASQVQRGAAMPIYLFTSAVNNGEQSPEAGCAFLTGLSHCLLFRRAQEKYCMLRTRIFPS